MAEPRGPRSPWRRWSRWPGQRPSSLLARVLRSVLALLVLGGVVVALSSWSNARQAARQAYDRLLLGAASDIAESIRILDGMPVADLPVSAFELLAQAPDDRIAYSVRGPQGALLTGYDSVPMAEVQSPRATEPVFFDAMMQDDSARYVEISRRFAERDFSGVVTVTVGQTRRARAAMARDLALNAMVPAGIAGVLLVLMAVFVVRQAVRPLRSIAETLLHRDPYDLTPFEEANLPAEVGVILHAMNRFMGRLDRQMEAMRNLISDTAHQLRTPVAAIRLQAESVADSAGDDPDGERVRPALDRLLRRTRSLGVLLDQLLSRALVVHRTDSVPRRPVDLRDIALDILDSRDHEWLAPETEVALKIGEEPVMVLADDFSLGQAGKNLLSNALKHGRAPVRIGVERLGSEAVLWVEDGGAGPDPELAARLGGRFERSTSSPEHSAGLGLSIVTAVAQAFDGRIALATVPDGFRVSLVLPAVSEALP